MSPKHSVKAPKFTRTRRHEGWELVRNLIDLNGEKPSIYIGMRTAIDLCISDAKASIIKCATVVYEARKYMRILPKFSQLNKFLAEEYAGYKILFHTLDSIIVRIDDVRNEIIVPIKFVRDLEID
jgi:hypothetical protein